MKKLRMVTMAVLGLAAAAVLAVVPSETYKTDFTGNGSTKAFAYTFKTLSASWVAVYFGSTKQTSGFTVAVNANQDSSPGGTVTFTTAPPTATEIHIQRAAPLKQESAWPPATPFRAKTLETQLDTQVMQLQQVDGRTTQLCEQVDQVMSLAQGPMGPKGADGSISNITQNLDFVSTYRGTNLAAPVNPNDSARLTDVTSLTDGTSSIPSWIYGTWIVSGTPNGNYIYKQPNGLITLILWVTAGASPPATVLTLPAGWRPVQTLRAAGLDGAIGNKPVWFEINGSGPIYIYGENIPAAITGHTYHLAVTYKGT